MIVRAGDGDERRALLFLERWTDLGGSPVAGRTLDPCGPRECGERAGDLPALKSSELSGYLRRSKTHPTSGLSFRPVRVELASTRARYSGRNPRRPAASETHRRPPGIFEFGASQATNIHSPLRLTVNSASAEPGRRTV